MRIPRDRLTAMENAAREASACSYAPYSGFSVGAAVLSETGEIFTGCNVENASFGLTACAERNAICRALADGHRHIAAVLVYTPTAQATPPCGACRQVIHEFAPQASIICVCDSEHRIETTLDALLPGAFSLQA